MQCVRPVISASALFMSAQTADRFPDVNNYHDRWPVTDLIKMHLKNTSSKHRKHVQRMAAGKYAGGDMGIKLKKAAHSKV
jgi:hypothetical protein